MLEVGCTITFPLCSKDNMFVQADVPALAMEEVAPVAISDAACLLLKKSLKENVMLRKRGNLHRLSAKEEEPTRKGNMQDHTRRGQSSCRKIRLMFANQGLHACHASVQDL